MITLTPITDAPRGIRVYQCPVCRKLFRHANDVQPLCTGPSESRDDHPQTLMKFIGIQDSKPLIRFDLTK